MGSSFWLWLGKNRKYVILFRLFVIIYYVEREKKKKFDVEDVWILVFD